MYTTVPLREAKEEAYTPLYTLREAKEGGIPTIYTPPQGG